MNLLKIKKLLFLIALSTSINGTEKITSSIQHLASIDSIYAMNIVPESERYLQKIKKWLK